MKMKSSGFLKFSACDSATISWKWTLQFEGALAQPWFQLQKIQDELLDRPSSRAWFVYRGLQ
ncbi:hypothetical protein Mapa_015249 [Marchantia paleacea]|nr:hypothetical protein Mapa_015249 [Marchantia paleacea]